MSGTSTPRFSKSSKRQRIIRECLQLLWVGCPHPAKPDGNNDKQCGVRAPTCRGATKLELGTSAAPTDPTGIRVNPALLVPLYETAIPHPFGRGVLRFGCPRG